MTWLLQYKIFIPNYFNAATISPMPKIATPQTRKDFRPINLSITINKIVSKIISTRFHSYLPNSISPNQSVFAKGKDICNNMLAQEILKDININCRGNNISIKLDIHIAFDRVNWNFAYLVLWAKNFNLESCSLIQRLISNNHYSLLSMERRKASSNPQESLNKVAHYHLPSLS